MSDGQANLTAYLATLAVIALLALAAAGVCIFSQVGNTLSLARITGALAFISGAITGLIGVIGTFRPKTSTTPGDTQADTNMSKVLDKVPPANPENPADRNGNPADANNANAQQEGEG